MSYTIYLDNTDIRDMGLRLLDSHEHPILPDTIDYTTRIAGMHGNYDFGAEMGSRTFNLPLGIKQQKSRIELQKRAREVAKFFTDRYGKPRYVKLQFGYEMDKFYNVRYSGSLPIERLVTLGKFTLPLVAHDPYAYASPTAYDNHESQQYDAGLQYDNGLMYPNTTSFDWVYRRHYTSIHNYSYYDTPLKLVINGHVINPRITNVTTGKQVMINGEYNGILVIDAKHYSVVRSDSSNESYFLTTTQPETVDKKIFQNEISRYSGDFISLVEGTNELVFEGGQPNATVSLIWEHRFM